MPNRILRDWTQSENINKISEGAEVFFVRLIMKADDHGCFHANPKLLSSLLYPLKNVSEKLISGYLNECSLVGAILIYQSEGRMYLKIKEFNQRLRTMTGKFPLPADNCLTNDGQLTVNCPPEVETKRSRKEVEDETKGIEKTKIQVLENVFLLQSEIDKLSEEFQEHELKWIYDRLSSYKLSSGKKYKSDYGAIKTWVIDSFHKAKKDFLKDNNTLAVRTKLVEDGLRNAEWNKPNNQQNEPN